MQPPPLLRLGISSLGLPSLVEVLVTLLGISSMSPNLELVEAHSESHLSPEDRNRATYGKSSSPLSGLFSWKPNRSFRGLR